MTCKASGDTARYKAQVAAFFTNLAAAKVV